MMDPVSLAAGFATENSPLIPKVKRFNQFTGNYEMVDRDRLDPPQSFMDDRLGTALTSINGPMPPENTDITPDTLAQTGLASLNFAGGIKKVGKVGDPIAKAAKNLIVFHGTPHEFNAERLVRHPNGRLEHIVGTPDQLPDVPPGAKVIENFPLGRFREDKIGTGEGNQGEGYGSYNAQDRKVGEYYRDRLNSTPDQQVSKDQDSPLGDARALMRNAIESDRAQVIQNKFGARSPELFNYQKKRALKYLESFYPVTKMWEGKAEGKHWAKIREIVENAKPGELTPVRVQRNVLVKSKLTANPNEFLDLDAPFKEQHPKVQKFVKDTLENSTPFEIKKGKNGIEVWYKGTPYGGARQDQTRRMSTFKTGKDASVAVQNYEYSFLRARGIENGKIPDTLPGAKIYDILQAYWGGEQGAAKAMKEAGIPGNRYFDSTSRSKKQGSKNYVVFDPAHLKILEKLGLVATLAPGADIVSHIGDQFDQDQ